MAVTVMLVDDHEVVRQGLRTLLEREAEITVVAEAGTVAEALERALSEKPSVVVMDVRLPDGSGVEACREILSALPDTRIVVLTSYADDEAIIASVMAGASAYLLKQTRGKALVEAILAVGRGESLLDPKVTNRVLEEVRARKTVRGRSQDLTETEHKILLRIAEGKTNREIGVEINLGEKTVKNYVSSLLGKLGFKRRAEAAAYVGRQRLDRL